MPARGVTDPAALLMQRMGPAVGPQMPASAAPPGMGGGAAGAPVPGGAPGGSPTPGGSPGAGDPQMMQLAMLAQKLMMQQKGTDYIKKFLSQVNQLLNAAKASQFMQSGKALKHIGGAMTETNKAMQEIGRESEQNAPLSSALTSMMTPPGGPGAPTGGPPAQGPTPPAYPLSNV